MVDFLGDATLLGPLLGRHKVRIEPAEPLPATGLDLRAQLDQVVLGGADLLKLLKSACGDVPPSNLQRDIGVTFCERIRRDAGLIQAHLDAPLVGEGTANEGACA